MSALGNSEKCLKSGRYARLMGNFWRHPRTEGLSNAARGIFCNVISYCADQGVSYVPRSAMSKLSKGRNTARNVAELVAAGLLLETSAGYEPRDWAQHNRVASRKPRDANEMHAPRETIRESAERSVHEAPSPVPPPMQPPREANEMHATRETIEESPDSRAREAATPKRASTRNERRTRCKRDANEMHAPRETIEESPDSRARVRPRTQEREEISLSSLRSESETPSAAPPSPPAPPEPGLSESGTFELTPPSERPSTPAKVSPRKASKQRRESRYAAQRRRVVELFNLLFVPRFGFASQPKHWDALNRVTLAYVRDGDVLDETTVTANIAAFLADTWWGCSEKSPGYSIDVWARNFERYATKARVAAYQGSNHYAYSSNPI